MVSKKSFKIFPHKALRFCGTPSPTTLPSITSTDVFNEFRRAQRVKRWKTWRNFRTPAVGSTLKTVFMRCHSALATFNFSRRRVVFLPKIQAYLWQFLPSNSNAEWISESSIIFRQLFWVLLKLSGIQSILHHNSCCTQNLTQLLTHRRDEWFDNIQEEGGSVRVFNPFLSTRILALTHWEQKNDSLFWKSTMYRRQCRRARRRRSSHTDMECISVKYTLQ